MLSTFMLSQLPEQSKLNSLSRCPVLSTNAQFRHVFVEENNTTDTMVIGQVRQRTHEYQKQRRAGVETLPFSDESTAPQPFHVVQGGDVVTCRGNKEVDTRTHAHQNQRRTKVHHA